MAFDFLRNQAFLRAIKKRNSLRVPRSVSRQILTK
ncbi:hypothetical protein CLOLEP_03747 [[Clostridium] leptum DSM 753]|uniref:Uncharacterized protein n=1 Tax=[Clostridium] leptum DSM 753 TaxID=428125 RepID=A7VYR9_9FIRM|nr:hypothetical protein CLOLEP_03747 [[Clostridium] leptum DSM 753]